VALFYSLLTDAYNHSRTPVIGEVEEQDILLRDRLILIGILTPDIPNRYIVHGMLAKYGRSCADIWE
jgi:hypothetical protein